MYGIMRPRIWVFSLCRNEANVIPFYLRHYGSFADRIIVWDDASDDGSLELLRSHPSVLALRWPYETGIDEDAFLRFVYDNYPVAKGMADWCIWCDIDEFIYSPDIFNTLEAASNYEVIQTRGYNMTGDGFPVDDGKSQIWEISQMGVNAPVYSKPIVFRPSATVRWNRGKHALENCDPALSKEPMFKLLHYRYMGAKYTAWKNAKNYARCGLLSGDKGAAWSCSPHHTGEHSPGWAEEAKKVAFNVIES